jgi:hypothetical protein
LPFIESYWLTVVYLIQNKDQILAEDTLYGRIQWLAENLYEEGQCKYYEACSLESITNAVRKLNKIGFLTRTERTIPRKGIKVTF